MQVAKICHLRGKKTPPALQKFATRIAKKTRHASQINATIGQKKLLPKPNPFNPCNPCSKSINERLTPPVFFWKTKQRRSKAARTYRENGAESASADVLESARGRTPVRPWENSSAPADALEYVHGRTQVRRRCTRARPESTRVARRRTGTTE